jgi:long-chain acyl-CoA synthetase
VEIKILDASGDEVPRGEPGEIATKSAGVMMGYWRDPEATAAALKDGWLSTGDIGYLDEEGYLFILDRKKDLIIRGGFNVYPRDIEDALLEHPAIHMAAVVGRPDTVLGEEIVAFVGLRQGHDVTVDELAEWSRERLGAYKWPREIHVVSEIPLTEVGKVNRKALRESLDEGSQSTK